jgi:allophanate hydrolase subunit 1
MYNEYIENEEIDNINDLINAFDNISSIFSNYAINTIEDIITKSFGYDLESDEESDDLDIGDILIPTAYDLQFG